MSSPLDPSAAAIDRLRLIAIVESSDDAIVSKDLDGTVRSWNRSAERIFGYTADEMVGQPIFRLIPPELHDEEHGLLARIRAGEHISHYETERIRKDGRRIRISLTLSPLMGPDGRLIGASVIKRDVTAHRALEDQLQQARRMESMGRLAGGIAHDFNNLLTVIGGLAILTARRMQEGTRERRDLDQIVQASERASALTQQLLTFGRKQVAETELLDLGAIVRGLESLLRRLIGEHITLLTMVEPHLGRVRGNRAQLEQVVMNLAANARDAMPDGGTLTIRVENALVNGRFAEEKLQLEPGSYVVLLVSDTGEGMDAVTQARVFEPFFSTKDPARGTGLGLATVYAIVEQAGGAIYLYSEVGRGTTFKVYLARVQTPPEAAGGPPPEGRSIDRSPMSGTVLLVEDEPGVRSFSAQVLEDMGYEVLTAGSGEEALDLALSLKRPIDVLVTDVVMPGMNGRVLAERLRAIEPGIAVLYMSRYADDMVLRAGVMTQGSAFLQKPFTPEDLTERLRAMVRAKEPSPPPP